MIEVQEGSLTNIRLTYPDAQYEDGHIIFNVSSGCWEVVVNLRV